MIGRPLGDSLQKRLRVDRHAHAGRYTPALGSSRVPRARELMRSARPPAAIRARRRAPARPAQAIAIAPSGRRPSPAPTRADRIARAHDCFLRGCAIELAPGFGDEGGASALAGGRVLCHASDRPVPDPLSHPDAPPRAAVRPPRRPSRAARRVVALPTPRARRPAGGPGMGIDRPGRGEAASVRGERTGGSRRGARLAQQGLNTC
jgi:hypothetical protein